MAKVITFSLDGPSVARAAKEVRDYVEEVKHLIETLIQTLTEEGIRVAAVQVAMLGAVDTGELSDSFIGFYDSESHVGIIRSIALYAYFVEYGTGIVGSQGPAHPEMEGVWAPPPSQYTQHDTNGHGEDGWYYIDDSDNKLHWTKGMPARPFMYQTFKELEQLSRQLAVEIFNGRG